jgi:hypothetical protein
MDVKDAVRAIKAAGHDISDEYSMEDCLGFLNTAIHEVSGMLIAARSPMMVEEMLLHDGESVPARYVASAGQYPMRITGQTVRLLGNAREVQFRFFRSKAPLENEKGMLPFDHEALNDYVVKVAVLYALNRNEYDVSQDKALYDELRQILVEAVTSRV